MLLLTFGTRPEYIKIKPLIDVFNKNGFEYKLLFTGQHEDLLQSIDVDYELAIRDKHDGNRLDAVVKSILDHRLVWKNITHVLVQGDTTSAFAIALSAFHRGIKIIHLEAGLRTYDKENPYPEEINRRLISQVADIHLCPTRSNYNNLINEVIDGEKFIVGNTAIDNLLPWKNKVDVMSNTVLITMHRRENHHWLDKWFIEISKIANEHDYLDFIIPLHPNPNVQKNKGYLTAKNIKIIEPLSHNDLLDILIKSRLVITDSGGIQEECSFFNIRTLVCRKVTERPEALGKSAVLVKSPNELNNIFNKYVIDFSFTYECPFGDGHSSEKIYNILKEKI